MAKRKTATRKSATSRTTTKRTTRKSSKVDLNSFELSAADMKKMRKEAGNRTVPAGRYIMRVTDAKPGSYGRGKKQGQPYFQFYFHILAPDEYSGQTLNDLQDMTRDKVIVKNGDTELTPLHFLLMSLERLGLDLDDIGPHPVKWAESLREAKPAAIVDVDLSEDQRFNSFRIQRHLSKQELEDALEDE